MWNGTAVPVDLEILSENDLFGRFYLKKVPGEGAYRNYYASLEAVRPLLESEKWRRSVTGYFINAPVTRDALRLSYFTVQPEKVAEAVDDLILSRGVEYAREGESPRPIFLSGPYGGEEIRFRRFLYVSTLVMLDIMGNDLLRSRRLFAEFRFSFMRKGEPYEDFFLKFFEEKSRTYRSMTELEKKQFWLDMAHWPNPPQVDWIHLPVNMVLGCDINSFGKWQEFIAAKYVLGQEDVGLILKAQGLDT